MEELKNPTAELYSPDSGKLITPAQAKEKYTAEKRFFCPYANCLDPERKLYLTHRGDLIYFSHYGNYEHEISPETLLHKLAIKYFEDLATFQIPHFKDDVNIHYPTQFLALDKSKTQTEYSLLKGIRPDVVIETCNGFQLAIEILVTHGVGDEKNKRIINHNLPTLEIDLSKFYLENKEQCKTEIDFIVGNLDRLYTRPPILYDGIKPLLTQFSRHLWEMLRCLVTSFLVNQTLSLFTFSFAMFRNFPKCKAECWRVK